MKDNSGRNRFTTEIRLDTQIRPISLYYRLNQRESMNNVNSIFLKNMNSVNSKKIRTQSNDSAQIITFRKKNQKIQYKRSFKYNSHIQKVMQIFKPHLSKSIKHDKEYNKKNSKLQILSAKPSHRQISHKQNYNSSINEYHLQRIRLKDNFKLSYRQNVFSPWHDNQQSLLLD